MALPTQHPKGDTIEFMVETTLVNAATSLALVYYGESSGGESFTASTANSRVTALGVSQVTGGYKYKWNVKLPSSATEDLKADYFDTYLRLFYDGDKRTLEKANLILTKTKPKLAN